MGTNGQLGGESSLEGQVYPCQWVATPKGIRAWVTDQPKIAVETHTFAKAEEALADEILDALGDGEAVLDFEPPPPREGTDGEVGALWTLDEQEFAHFEVPARYFVGGLCDHCVMPRGPRTAHPLELTKVVRGSDMAMARAHGAPGVGPMLTIVSEKLVSLLTDAERAAFEWRAVVQPVGRGVRPFFEIVHIGPTIPLVVPNGRGALAWRCEVCGFEWIGVKRAGRLPTVFVSESDLAAGKRSLTAIDAWQFARFVVSEDRWVELVRTGKLSQVTRTPVIILAESAVNRALEFLPRPRESRPPTLSTRPR